MAYDQRSLDDYVDVATRIADFRKQYPEGTLQPADPAHPWEQAIVNGISKDGKPFAATMIVYTAAAYRTPDDPRPGIGIAWEIFPGRTPYTLGSELQNAETSAWGRAIIAVGASDSKKGIASREEVAARRAEREDGLPTNKDGSLSRSRTTDEQKAAAGVMTDAEQKAHSQLAKPPPNSSKAERVVPNLAGDLRASLEPARARREAERPDWDGRPGDSRTLDVCQVTSHDRYGIEGCTECDPWLDGPAGLTPQDDPEDRPGTATQYQLRAMHAAFTQLGVKDRDKRLELTRTTLGLDMLHSSAQLSYRQAADLLLAFNGLKVAK